MNFKYYQTNLDTKLKNEFMSKPKLQEEGIVYCATGKELFLREAYISINSIKKYNTNIQISIFVDEENFKRINKDLFDSIFLIKNPEFGFGDKIYAMKNTPYQKTIYLDCDTVVADDISEIYNMLEKYEIAASNPPFKNKYYRPNHYQAGIIFYKMNSKVSKFFNLWDENYDRINHGNDQPSFRETLSKLPISLFIFPPNYNFRSPFASYIQGKIKILHDHNLSRANDKVRRSFINYLNESTEERYWFPKKGVLKFPEKFNIFNKILSLLEDKIFKKIINFWNYFPKKKLINYYLIKSFPWFINWIIPKQYRKRMKIMHKKMENFSTH